MTRLQLLMGKSSMAETSVGDHICSLITEWEQTGIRIDLAIAAERERCAKIADSFSAEILSAPKNTVDLINGQAELTYTMGYGISAERIAAKIRSGE